MDGTFLVEEGSIADVLALVMAECDGIPIPTTRGSSRVSSSADCSTRTNSAISNECG